MTNIDKRWEGLTINGELAVGVYYAGSRHKTFTMRIPLAGDLIDVQSEHPEASLHVATMAIYHRQLLSLGDIPAEALTFDLLRSELAETDLALLGAADEALEKSSRCRAQQARLATSRTRPCPIRLPTRRNKPNAQIRGRGSSRPADRQTKNGYSLRE